MSTPHTGLQVDGVTVRFGVTTALDAIDLTVIDGEIVALVGPSGCGKSTLLRVIAGLQKPTEGSVTWAGTDLATLAPHERDVGLMFQTHALFAHRNVEENIAFGPRMQGASRQEQAERVRTLVDLVGLAGFENRSVDSLSGGEAQRVALARALAPSPGLLLLDEPLGALDRALRESLVGELAVLLRTLGQTTLHVTHDQDEAFTLADRVAVINAGRIQRIDTPEQLWTDPRSAFVAGFLGHPVVTVNGDRVAVTPGAVQINAGAAHTGLVTGTRFLGDRWEVRLQTDALDGSASTLIAYVPMASGRQLRAGVTLQFDLQRERLAPIITD